MELVGSLVKDALPELFTEGQVVAAEQQFHRRLAEYEMNIEQQKLFREDLRDLVELTVGRMDIYHLVGALLLEFCIHFYCENEMLESTELPAWVSTIFLLSNLAATGYLVFAVWLSMHASVASHSIGVRLLTRFARLSIPGRKELESIARAPLMPIMERFAKLGERFGVAGASGGAAGAVAASALRPSPEARGGPAAQAPRVSFSRTVEEHSAGAGSVARMRMRSDSQLSVYEDTGRTAMEEGERAQQDRQRHFRRFLREQRRWLCYDAYARVCMSLGMNQMLAALSYYIVGKVALKAPGAAMVSLLGFQTISFLLLRLDITSGFHATKEAIAIICLVPLPPIYIGSLTWTARANPDFHKVLLQYLFLPGYVLHGAWLFIIAVVLAPGAADTLAIPRRLRTVLYLDVLHLDQEEVADAVMAQEARSFADELRDLSNELEQEMQAVVREEQDAGAVSVARRQSPELVMLKDQLQELVDEIRSRTLGASDSRVNRESRRVEWILERFSVWQEAPKVEASLQALQNFQVQSFLSENDKQLVSQAQADFLKMCQDLDLGLCTFETLPEEASDVDAESNARSGDNAPANGGDVAAAAWATNAPAVAVADDDAAATSLVSDASAPSIASSPSRLRPLEVDPAERPMVRVEYDSGFEAASVWIRPENNRLSDLQHQAPGSLEPTTDVGGMLQGTLPAWRSHAEHLLHEPRTPVPSLRPSMLSAAEVPVESTGSAGSQHRNLGGRRSVSLASTWEASERPLMPASATPPEELPRVIVRRFTLAMACLWFASAAVHLYTLLSGATLPEFEVLRTRELSVTWPEPAGLFDVATLHCNGSSVVVDSGFSLYVAERAADRLGELVVVGGTGAKAMLCGTEGCSVLGSTLSEKGALQVAPLKAPLGYDGNSSVLRVPPSWRHVAATRAACAPAPCEALTLAGWDGAQIVVAAAHRGAPQDSWQVQSKFAVRPGRGGCTRQQQAAGLCDVVVAGTGGAGYDYVQALQLGRMGTSLAVLHGPGLLDGWDLAKGARVGQWQLAGNILAMCHDERELLVVREGEDGGAPVMEAAPLPRELAAVGCQPPQEQGERGDGDHWTQVYA